jgi:hypothetical protein
VKGCVFTWLYSGLRHLSVLKLIGKDMEDMGGTLELYPINGKEQLLFPYWWENPELI